MKSEGASRYEEDFYGWTQWQVQALAERQVSELDWQNLQAELEGLGRQEYRELVSRLTVLLGHLLKWEYQPENRCRSWFLNIREQRRAINRHFRRNPSLKSSMAEAVEDGFAAGVDLALRETNLPLRTFPEKCPYRFEEAIADSFLCDTSQDWQ
ncbi:DUF29 domain-containing protein [Anabaenopsis tanganyikae CS-531]|uniref:DUF29 domain-containing protein n=2 Tax=Anabaenopsis TaxID=110103 RepID=A0ABT5AUZ7_9CYAN|nr:MULTISPECIES: DUF29 domain-containing protein [Anabaenopsis]MDB9541129.1 DUF29 domain-containing protein [Anabaenopsis arnoldii]MDH6093568.1 DUF29 domain-containing protein [Anabaenopsis arnoldii]MDH6106135.1 DUF29 domain-containing protein [Anabaenopsis tanganyikae CS-531]